MTNGLIMIFKKIISLLKIKNNKYFKHTWIFLWKIELQSWGLWK